MSSSRRCAIAASSGTRRRPGVLVGERQERVVSPTIAPTSGPQMPARADDDVGRDLAPVRDDPPDATAVGRMPVTVCSPRNRAPPLGRTAGLGLAGARRPWPARRSGRGSRPAPRRDRAAATGGDRLVRIDQPAVDAPRGRPPVAPVKVDQALRGHRDLEAADLAEAPLPVELERRELLDGVARELGHRLRPVGLEDEPGSVRGRAAGGEQRTLVHDRDVRPARARSARRPAAADDPGADDHDVRARHRGTRSLVASAPSHGSG